MLLADDDVDSSTAAAAVGVSVGSDGGCGVIDDIFVVCLCNERRAALAESKKDAEEALVVAAAREEAFLSREAGAEERAAAAEGKARQWEKKADELALTLGQKVTPKLKERGLS